MATARTRPRQPPSTPPPPEDYEHTGFILAEEDALKTMLENWVKLPNNRGVDTPTRVWYRYPAAEHATTYPFVTLDLIGIEPAYDLWTSEYYLHPDSEIQEDSNTGLEVGRTLYDPSTSPVIAYDQWPPEMFFQRYHYLTFRLIHQIGLWCNNAYHDRLLTARMIRDWVMPRPFWLFVPTDGVWRRLEVLEWTAADIASQEGASKRIFRKLITVSIQTDIPQDRLDQLTLEPRIQKLLVRMRDTQSGTWFTGQEDTPPEVTTIPPTEWWQEEAIP